MSDKVPAWRQHARTIGCYCAYYRKPCTYHEGYQDGWDEAESKYQPVDEDDVFETFTVGDRLPGMRPRSDLYKQNQGNTMTLAEQIAPLWNRISEMSHAHHAEPWINGADLNIMGVPEAVQEYRRCMNEIAALLNAALAEQGFVEDET